MSVHSVLHARASTRRTSTWMSTTPERRAGARVDRCAIPRRLQLRPIQPAAADGSTRSAIGAVIAVRDADGNTKDVPSARYGRGRRWRARYVDERGGEHAKAFTRKSMRRSGWTARPRPSCQGLTAGCAAERPAVVRSVDRGLQGAPGIHCAAGACPYRADRRGVRRYAAVGGTAVSGQGMDSESTAYPLRTETPSSRRRPRSAR
jgi:hypothetical protein